jgi:hypothetical protein
MKRLIIISFVCVLALAFTSTSAFAASAKASAQFIGIQSVSLNESVESQGWKTVFTQGIHMANNHDIYISPSFEVGLTTSTAVMSKKLVRAIAEADAQVKVRVIIDGDVANPVAPGEVIYSKRNQKLIAEFAGLYDLWGDDACYTTTTTCVDDDPLIDGCQGEEVVTGIEFSDDEACFDAEYLQLILSTMAAHTFNFIAADVSTGDHIIEVQVQLTYDLGDGVDIYDRPDLADEVTALGMYGSQAWIGKGSVLIESVRMVKGEDIIVE